MIRKQNTRSSLVPKNLQHMDVYEGATIRQQIELLKKT